MSETILVLRTGQAPLRVRGEVIASGETSWNNASSHYSGSPGRQQKARIIKTATGKFVVALTYETQWEGEHDATEAAVFPSLKQCVGYLSERVPNWMLHELIAELGEAAVVVG